MPQQWKDRLDVPTLLVDSFVGFPIRPLLSDFEANVSFAFCFNLVFALGPEVAASEDSPRSLRLDLAGEAAFTFDFAFLGAIPVGGCIRYGCIDVDRSLSNEIQCLEK